MAPKPTPAVSCQRMSGETFLIPAIAFCSFNICIILNVLMFENHSVTRLGEISPLGQHYMNLCQMVEGLFRVWQFFKPNLAKLLCFGQPFNDVNDQIWKIL